MEENKEARQAQDQSSEVVDKGRELEQFIVGGFEFIKQGNYREGIQYYRNAEVAKRVGFFFNPTPTQVLILKTPAPEDVPKIADSVAWLSGFDTSQAETPKISISNVFIAPLSLRKEDAEAIEIPESLYHNVALNHIEEWLHGLRYLREGVPIAGFDNEEVDIAAYLRSKDVSLTDEFLDRYNRRELLAQEVSPPQTSSD